ncbi:MAG: DNA-3-methyladenine glycosylase I [Candidatus Omnitrophica bacterium]|nr:DNA-3-methyladenine glycosylase I [Candidatus Omnitrophota bacterium]
MTRCEWAQEPPIMTVYHDTEWGVPLHDDRKLFEFLVLEGMQAGLSWLTVLKKRESFRRAFDGFDAERVASYGRAKVRQLLGDAGIIRNRLKIEAAIANAQAFLRVQEQHGSFARFMWELIGGRPIQHRFKSLRELPARTPESDAMSAALKVLGFRFVGSTICYAHMQATGMVNDHVVSCFRHRDVQRKEPRRSD